MTKVRNDIIAINYLYTTICFCCSFKNGVKRCCRRRNLHRIAHRAPSYSHTPGRWLKEKENRDVDEVRPTEGRSGAVRWEVHSKVSTLASPAEPNKEQILLQQKIINTSGDKHYRQRTNANIYIILHAYLWIMYVMYVSGYDDDTRDGIMLWRSYQFYIDNMAA